MGGGNTVQSVCGCLVVIVLFGSLCVGKSHGIANVTKYQPIPYTSPRDVTNGQMISKSYPLDIRCPIPVSPKNGYIVEVVISVDAVLQVHCNEGYSLSGPTEFVCVVKDGAAQWSPALPQTCIASAIRCPIPVSPKNGYIVGEVINVGAVMQVHCNEGYSLSSPTEFVCVVKDGAAQWSPALPQSCIALEIRCPIPVSPKNGYIVGEVINVGAVLQVHCNEGYSLSSPTEFVCVVKEGTAQWSPALPQSCIASAIRCPIPVPPKNGYFIGEVISVGAVLQVRCNEGYSLSSPTNIACVVTNGEAMWSPALPETCIAQRQRRSLDTASLATLQGNKPSIPEPRQVISPLPYDVFSKQDSHRQKRPLMRNSMKGSGSRHPSFQPSSSKTSQETNHKSLQEAVISPSSFEHSKVHQSKTHRIQQEYISKSETDSTSNKRKHTLPAICLPRPDPGRCDASYRRFYFKESTMECHRFIYTGCEGNANNFETLSECNKVCLGH